MLESQIQYLMLPILVKWFFKYLIRGRDLDDEVGDGCPELGDVVLRSLEVLGQLAK